MQSSEIAPRPSYAAFKVGMAMTFDPYHLYVTSDTDDESVEHNATLTTLVPNQTSVASMVVC